MGFFMSQGLFDYANFVDFKLLPTSGHDGDMLRDMHSFVSFLTVKAMYYESFYVHQALEGQRLPHELRLFVQL